ncbi:UNVERIFIED_CONTAM: hypothetical protein NCL1_10738 [Trichonephila clavipes]
MSITYCNHMCCQSCNDSLRNRFSTGQGSASHGKGITRLSPHCYYHSLTCLIPRCVSNRAYLESFGSVYEKDKDTFDISQSADPTCDGLVSPRDGSRIMKLTKTKHPTSGCQFPSWVTSTRHWHTLDGRMNYYFSHRNNSYRIVHQHTSHAETKVTCTDEVYSSPNSTTVVAYSMQGWAFSTLLIHSFSLRRDSNGFVCLTFHQREKHIIEIQTGKFHFNAYIPAKIALITFQAVQTSINSTLV